MSEIELSAVEARVLGALVEKSITTPQYYPMTPNAIMAACNQKSCRHPVMALSEGEVGRALNALQAQRLVDREDSRSRAPKWRQQMRSQLLLKGPTQAVLVTLLLRGPQTPAELLRNAEALGGPGDREALLAALEDLADRAQPLVREWPRGAGQKEARWVALLGGEPEAPAPAPARTVSESAAATSAAASRLDALEARIARLEARLAELEGGG